MTDWFSIFERCSSNKNPRSLSPLLLRCVKSRQSPLPVDLIELSWAAILPRSLRSAGRAGKSCAQEKTAWSGRDDRENLRRKPDSVHEGGSGSGTGASGNGAQRFDRGGEFVFGIVIMRGEAHC